MYKAEQDRHLIQYLMGFNEIYTVLRSNILMMNPLPSMSQAFLRLIQEEKQREFKLTSHIAMESTSLNVNAYIPRKNSIGRSFLTNFRNNSCSGGSKNYASSSSHSRGTNNHAGGNYYIGSSSSRNCIVCDFR